jgi:hypothetical protein
MSYDASRSHVTHMINKTTVFSQAEQLSAPRQVATPPPLENACALIQSISN